MTLADLRELWRTACFDELRDSPALKDKVRRGKELGEREVG